MGGFDALHPAVQHHIVNELGWRALRPLQEAAIDPLLNGEDALLLAPTAGGKTEAAVFPVLSAMAAEDWRGSSVLYLCPLRALLNNLEPRIDGYARWVGRRASVRHGDTGAGDRRRQVLDRHDILLTTPESLEAILVSATVDPHVVLADVRTVIVDEVHAFAGDDRGWHLLAVLERVSRIAGRPLQRIGLSATVGNPEELLGWLQGSNRGVRAASVVSPAASATATDMQIDYVGSIANAGTVISRMHAGEKRLVFADSRRTVEQLAVRLRELDVDTYVSHSSLSASERRRSEAAFAEARDCVITATSTLELGIDVGDLDRVIQIGAPGTVASLLQRLGRTGRRPGAVGNMLFLATDGDQLLQAAGLALLWSEGYVEPIKAPPTPAHIAAQQLLALALQEGRIGRNTWPEWLTGVELAEPSRLAEIANWLVTSGHLDADSGMLFIGPAAERRYGRRHFMELMSVFTSSPEVTILHGREEIGTVSPLVLANRVQGPRVVLLAGRAWQVTSIDWSRHRAWAEPTDASGKARWSGQPIPLSFELADAMRRVLLGDTPIGVGFTQRAERQLEELRQDWAARVDRDRTVVLRSDKETSWWTWAGSRANATLAAVLSEADPALLSDSGQVDNLQIPLRPGGTVDELKVALDAVTSRYGPELVGAVPAVTQQAVDGLKFSDLLPASLAVDTLAARMADRAAAAAMALRPVVWRSRP